MNLQRRFKLQGQLPPPFPTAGNPSPEFFMEGAFCVALKTIDFPATRGSTSPCKKIVLRWVKRSFPFDGLKSFVHGTKARGGKERMCHGSGGKVRGPTTLALAFHLSCESLHPTEAPPCLVILDGSHSNLLPTPTSVHPLSAHPRILISETMEDLKGIPSVGPPGSPYCIFL